MLKKILILFLLSLLLFFIFKDHLLKVGISYLLNKEFSLEAGIEKAKLNFNNIVLEGFSLTKGDLDLSVGKARVDFDLFKRSIEDLEISKCHLKFKNGTIDFALKKSKSILYTLNISSLKFKDKEIKNISIPLAIDADTISFSRIDSDFLGHSAHISGILNYRDRGNICLRLSLEVISFKNVINLFSKEEDFTLVGDFDGRLELCLDKGKVSKIDGDFHNTSGGAINIEKEASLGFLQRYLDEASYDALVDNFKYYTYNKGRIKITEEGGTIALNLDFGSDELGQRNISVNLHNILGGGE